MKRFKKPSMLLFLMLGVLGIGWYADRVRLLESLDKEHRLLEQERVRSIEHSERITVAAMTYAHAHKLLAESRSDVTLKTLSPTNVTNDVSSDLSLALDAVWHREREIDQVCQKSGAATELGSRILDALGCSVDGFFENIETGKYKTHLRLAPGSGGSLRAFVERCADFDDDAPGNY